jgi:endonuclease-3 related protein
MEVTAVGQIAVAPVGPAPAEGWEAWLLAVLDRLHTAFGPRHWWPSVKAPPPARAEPFEMIAGAILVQNVAWSNAEKALLALDGAGLLDLAAIHGAPVEQIEPLIRPAGYFRQKAKKLKGFAAYVTERYGGDLKAMLSRPLEPLRAELLALNGIGPETADCILCYAAGKPVMAMDTYTRRIFSRVGIFPPAIRYEQMQAFFHRYLPADTALRGEYHAQVDTLGHRICLKTRPACEVCPLATICRRIGVAETASNGRTPAPWAEETGG